MGVFACTGLISAYNLIIRLDPNSTIDEMLMLANEYGLSHVFSLREFQNIGDSLYELPYYFPYLDIHLSGDLTIEFYYRGTKDRKLKFKNLFEYLLWTASNGQG